MAFQDWSGTGYYSPTSVYGGGYGAGQFAQTPFGNQYLENEANRGTAFTRYLAEQGVDDYSGYGTWARGQLGRINQGYMAALATNPFLEFEGPGSYLSGLNLRNIYQGLSPVQRGENPAMYAGRTRWIPR